MVKSGIISNLLSPCLGAKKGLFWLNQEATKHYVAPCVLHLSRVRKRKRIERVRVTKLLECDKDSLISKKGNKEKRLFQKAIAHQQSNDAQPNPRIQQPWQIPSRPLQRPSFYC